MATMNSPIFLSATILSRSTSAPPRVLQRRVDELAEERVRGHRAGLELGVELAGHEPRMIGQLDDLSPRVVRLPAVIVRPFVVLVGSHPEPVLSDEVAASFWVPLESLNDDTGWRDTVVTAGGLEFTRRAFHHGDFVVWGMTERILASFLELAR